MASTSKAVWAAIATAINTYVNGSGSYTHDLTGAGRVSRSRLAAPPRTPFCCVVLDEVGSTMDETLGVYRRELVFTVVGWASAGADTAEAREDAACDLLDDLMRACEEDRSLSGLVLDVILHGRSFVGSEEGSGAVYPTAVIRLECSYPQESGS